MKFIACNAQRKLTQMRNLRSPYLTQTHSIPLGMRVCVRGIARSVNDCGWIVLADPNARTHARVVDLRSPPQKKATHLGHPTSTENPSTDRQSAVWSQESTSCVDVRNFVRKGGRNT